MIDFRSDTVTRPTAAMKQAMVDAELGDDVFSSDPTVNRLEAVVAERLGKEAALFVTSGTQSNLSALLSHCQRGEEYIAGDLSHIYGHEAGGGAVFGSIQPQTVPMMADGLPDPVAIELAVKPDDNHYPISRLLCIENTMDGKVQSIDRMDEAVSVGRKHGLSIHLDGARMWNASVALGVSGAELTAGFDSVSMCLSKWLGTPAGSVLSGSADFIGRARRWRKMLGGGMRQSGMLAAAGLHALDHHIDRLADDHDRAERLVKGLAEIPAISITSQDTNMVWIEIDSDGPALQETLLAQGIETLIGAGSPASCRLVCHLDITDDDVETTIGAFARALGN